MAEPVRARRLTDQEGSRLQQIVRRGKHGSVRVRRAMIIMASASGTPVPAIARLVAADEDTVRDVIHLFNAKGLAALDPQWAGGRPRLISDDDIAVIVTAATTGPEKLGLPFTCWSLRKLAAYLTGAPQPVRIGRERLRQILHARGISFQRTRTWKESRDPERDAKLDRIEHVTSSFRTGVSRLTNSGRCRSARSTAPPGRRANGPPGCPRPITAPTASAASTAATPWRTTSCGAPAASAKAAITPWPRCSRSGPPAPAATACSSSWTTCPPTKPRRSAAGRLAPTSNYASPRQTRPGPTRSKPSSGRSARSSWAARSTATTPCWPASSRITCAGAMPTPATPTSSPPSAANAPASAASASSAGDAPRSRPREPVNVRGHRTSRPAPRCGELPAVGSRQAQRSATGPAHRAGSAPRRPVMR